MATTSYPANDADWKGRFIYALAAALNRTGEATVALWGPPGQLPNGVISTLSVADAACLQRIADKGGIAHLLRRKPFSGLRFAGEILSRLRAAGRRTTADLYHVNWLQLLLGLPNDGRAAYVGVLGSDYGLLRVPGMIRLLRRACARRTVILAPNASWMASELEQAFGDLAEVRPNPFGVDPAWFDVQNDPAQPHEWLTVSRITRKKLGDLPAWGQGLFTGTRRLRLFGPMQEQIRLPNWIEQGGPTDPKALCTQLFPRATGLLSLSRHDEGRPQVIIEAMAAGLPVIASRLPAHSDLIRHGETGWLVDNPDQLADALRMAETPEIGHAVGQSARRWTRENIGTWDNCAQRCVAAYRDVSAGKSLSAA